MEIFLLLAQDGLTNGAIYALLAIALVLVFLVSRVIMVQAGEFVSYAALSLAIIQSGHVPGLVWIMAAVCSLIGLREIIGAAGRRAAWHAALAWIGAPNAIAGAAALLVPLRPPLLIQIALALAIVTPIGPAMYRLAYRRIARQSTLVLLIVSVAVQLVLSGIGLVLFGPEGGRTVPFADGFIDLGLMVVPAQSLWVFAVSGFLVIVFYLFFRHTMQGAALRAAAYNPVGAVLMGIRPESAGQLSFGLAAFLCAVSGAVISPIVTIYYDTGFLIGLKAFVGAVIGAMASFPLAAGGALVIGLLESFAAFASSTYKEVIVFSLMVPILLVLSLLTRDGIGEEEFGGRAATPGRTPSRHLAAIVACLPLRWCAAGAAAFFLILPYLLDASQIMVANYVLLYTIVALGIVLLTGIAGQVSFGQAAFVGVGAYSAAIAARSCDFLRPLAALSGATAAGADCGVPPWASLLLSLALTTVVAFLLGTITLRMRGHFLPIATISWGIGIFYFLGSNDALGGFSGLTDLPPLSLAMPPGLSYEGRLYYLILFAAAASGIAVANLLDSRSGRAIRALRGRSVVAESSGVHTHMVKVRIFVLAALLACISGWLYAQVERFVNPSPFSLMAGVDYLFMTVVGGAGQISGALFGAASVRVLTEALQDLLSGSAIGRIGNLEHAALGIIIIVILHRTRGGIANLLGGLVPRRIVERRSQPRAALSVAPRPARGALLLDIRGATKRFGGLIALDNVSFRVHAGEIVALIGPNGAGKSTLFNLVTGVSRATAGEILIFAKRARRLSAHDIAALRVARTFQHVKLLLDRSVLENVALGAYGRTRAGMARSILRLDRAEEARTRVEGHLRLERVGLADAADRPAGELPLGQQRLIEIARALAAEPVLGLLDEPAAGLRRGEKQQLAELLRQLRSDGMGILLVEHDMGFVMGLADRIVVMNFGRKIAEGSAREVQADPIVREAYLGA